MMLSRAYFADWIGQGDIKAFAYGRGLSPRGASKGAYLGRVGLGDSLSDAQARLVAAGYSGAQCGTELVTYPGGSYTQDICSAPGYQGGMEPGLVNQMTPAQLAAQRAYEQNTYDTWNPPGGSQQSYFQLDANNAANISNITPVIGGSPVSAPPAAQSAPQQQAASQVSGSAVSHAASGGAGTSNTIPATTSSGFDFSSLVSGNNILWLAGGAAALLFLMKGKR